MGHLTDLSREMCAY